MRQERLSFNQARRSTQPNLRRTATEGWLFAAVFVATLFFTCITPPFQAPDENQHYMKALLLSEGRILTERRGDSIGADLPAAALNLHDADFPTGASSDVRLFDRAMLDKAWNRADGKPADRRFADFPNVANYPPTLYAPVAAGLVIGRGIGLPPLGAFYTGRLANALFALAMLGLALRLMPFGRSAMLATALLPTFCYQNSSLSPDAVINGIGFLGLAVTLHIGFAGRARASNKALLLIAPLLALAKGVYLPLLAAGLRGRERRSWLILITMAVGAISFIAWMKLSGGSQALYHIASRKTGEMTTTAPLADQLAVILRDPSGYIHVLFSSIVERTPVYALQIVGRFGWNAILLPLLAYPLALVMLGSAVLSGSTMRFPVGQRLWWLAVAAGIAILIETAMYLTGTPLGADYIQGTQGRYFLPILPLVLIALMPAAPVRHARIVFAGSAILLLSIAVASAFDSFWVHGFVTADGMPPHDSLLRALTLPLPRW